MVYPNEQRAEVVSADGTPIAAWRCGSGSPLVLVHGMSADHTNWAQVAVRLAERFSVWAVDRRGRGGSGDASAYALEREAEDVAAVVVAAGESGGGRATLVGHSFGGLCSLEAAIRFDRLHRLVLYEPPLGFDPPSPEVVDGLRELRDRGDLDGVLASALRDSMGLPEEEIERLRSLPAWRGRADASAPLPREVEAEAAYRFDRRRVAGLNTPTLLLLGGASAPWAERAVAALADALPDARTRVIPGQEHEALETAPGHTTDEILRFLDAPGPRTRW